MSIWRAVEESRKTGRPTEVLYHHLLHLAEEVCRNTSYPARYQQNLYEPEDMVHELVSATCTWFPRARGDGKVTQAYRAYMVDTLRSLYSSAARGERLEVPLGVLQEIVGEFYEAGDEEIVQ